MVSSFVSVSSGIVTVIRSTIILAVVLLFYNTPAEAQWMQFRGPGGRNMASAAGLPQAWSLESGANVAWKAELSGRGVSGPIVVGSRVFVTSSSGEEEENQLHVEAYDVNSGQRLWHKQYQATGNTNIHGDTANAAPTPASDGQRIIALFSSNEVLCHDLDGNLLWRRDLGVEHEVETMFGMASSPLIIGGLVIIQGETAGDSFAEALDIRTGETRWQLDRPQKGNWATPLAHSTTAAADTIVMQSTNALELLNAATGETIRTFEQECETMPSSTIVPEHDLLLVPANGITALRASGPNALEVVWQSSELSPGAASPVVAGDRVYTINRRGGVLSCGDVTTGELLWKKRLGGDFWATPLAVGDRLYCANADGQVFVIDTTTEGEVVAENKFDDEVWASPAVAGNAIFFRGYTNLWKIANTGATAAVPPQIRIGSRPDGAASPR